MKKKVAIVQSNYIPWKGYFDIINMVDEFIIYDDVQFTKNDWRNRNKIKTRDGVRWITIPVRQESLSQKICETKVSQTNWASKHWKTLVSNYSKTSNFKEYAEAFENFYSNPGSNYLSEINCSLLKMINQILKINTKLSFSQNFKLVNGKNERLIDLIKQVGGSEYVSGPAASGYLDKSLFHEADIKVTWMNYSGYPEYPQLFPPFQHEVSVIDLIFNTGGNARNFMKSFNTNTIRSN
jgi:hypothetical protein